MARWLCALLAALLAPAMARAGSAPPAIESSIVRIFNFSQRGDWYAPWNSTAVQRSTGSGIVVEGGLILTNAHVVSDSRMVILFLHNDPNPHEAQVVVAGHDCDLALVRPVEKGLLESIPALPFGGLPALRSVVETYGYPVGGEQISSTRGVVSRIEMQRYVHSAVDSHLTVQTDAAINPGNSGGAVVQDGKLVGVAFQNAAQLDGAGYFIPMEIVRHFLDDVADGRYDGYPEMGISVSTMINEAARRRAGMKDGESGVRIDRVTPGASAHGLVHVGDVLLAVDGHAVANDGSVALNGVRAEFGALVDRRQVGEAIMLKLLRQDGSRADVKVPLRPFAATERFANAYDRLPRYYVFGGLTFVPLDRGMLATYGEEWPTNADRPLIREFLFRPLEEPERVGDEGVVLLRRLDHPVNVNIAWFRNEVIAKVNGKAVRRLEDVIAAIEGNTGPFDVFESAYNGRLSVLDHQEALRVSAAILAQYGIEKDRRL